MKEAQTFSPSRLTSEEAEKLNLEPCLGNSGFYRCRESERQLFVLRVDDLDGLPHQMVTELKSIPPDHPGRMAIADLGFFLFGYLLKGERKTDRGPECYLFVTKRVAQKIWPVH